MDQRPNNYNDQGPNGQGPNGNGGPGGPKNKSSLLVLLICVLATLLIWTVFSNILQSSTSKEITYDKFLEMLDKGEVKSVELQSGVLTIVPREQKVEGVEFEYSTTAMEDSTTLTARLLEAEQKTGNKITFNEIQPDPTGSIIYTILSLLVPFVFLIILMNWLMRKMNKGGGMMGVGKSKAKAYVQQETGVTFKDVAGEDEAKESLQEVVDFLHNPGKYTTIGAKLPKGALLVGPPGTGKTLLAKAVAGEAHVPFFSLSGSDFVEMFVGVGASRVRDLFEEAKKNAPCIIFIDEIDAIGKSRDSRYGGGNDEREQTLNQLLAEMDGFDSSKGIIILAATNRPEILDKALLRPGRFDRRIIVERPDLKGRIDVLKVHAKNVCMDETVDFKEIALATSGAVGSDLANIINEAALLAVRNGRNAVSQSDLFESVEVVIAGKAKKDRVLSAEERRIVSYHEVGHALVAALQKNTEPVQKITIIPRTMGALGYVMQVPEEEKYLMSEKQIREELVTMLAGRAAESIVFDSVTTGASNDIEQATKMARAMITQYGMSEKFGLIGLTTVEDQYLGGRATLNCGEATAAEIDQEVMKILKAAYDQALALLADNRDCLDKIAAFLIERETITGKEFMKIFHEVKGIPDSETEQAEANASNPAENDSQPDGQDEPTLVEAKTDNGASSESDINVSLETKAED